MLGVIKRNFKYVDKETFVGLYKSLVRSHLEYAAAVARLRLRIASTL